MTSNNLISVRTKNVGRSADLWGYTLRVGKWYVNVALDGKNFFLTDSFASASVFVNIKALRDFWRNYREALVNTASSQ